MQVIITFNKQEDAAWFYGIAESMAGNPLWPTALDKSVLIECLRKAKSVSSPDMDSVRAREIRYITNH